MTVIEGQEVLFKIVITGFPLPTLKWYHNEKFLMEEYSVIIGEDGSLHIPSSEMRHGGIYKLVAENSKESVEREVKLTVLDEKDTPSVKDVDLSPIPTIKFGSFVSKNHKNSNEGFKNTYEVHYI